MPRYTPKDWFECDLFELTAAGYTVEYEIKISRSDFRADAAKELRRYNWATGTHDVKHKHTKLADGTCFPNRFYYAVPEGLIKLEEVPAWAGLIEFRPNRKVNPTVAQDKVVKSAPRLHERKADPALRTELYRTAYYRMIPRTCLVQVEEPDWSI